MSGPVILRCSFCDTSQKDTPKLIAGPAVYICAECVDLCVEIIADGIDGLDVRPDGVPVEGRPPMGRLDASWRGDYIAKATADDRQRARGGASVDHPRLCVFCQILASGEPDETTHIVHHNEHVIAILNAYPYTSGHVMVMPRRHVASLDGLTAEEHTALWCTVTEATEVVTRAYGAEGLNVGANLGRAAGAGIPGHLHVHVVPRWNGDTNFMTAIAETRVVPESLDVSWQRLRQAWDSGLDK